MKNVGTRRGTFVGVGALIAWGAYFLFDHLRIYEGDEAWRLLITPGILTDAVGFTLMTGPGRNWVAKRIRSRLETSADATRIRDETGTDGPGGGRIIEL